MARFSETEAQAVTAALALDEVDRRGELVDRDTRRRVTREAIERHGSDGDAWLAARAGALIEPLRSAVPRLDAWLAASDPRPSAWPWVVVASVLGLATNALGPDRAVSVLAPPLLGLILWNLVVFAGIAVRWLRGTLSSPDEAPRQPLAIGLLLRFWRRRQGSASVESTEPSAARWLGRTSELWWPVITPLASARAARLLHLAAAAAVVGTVAGLYLRGLAVEYRATWESTFLGDSAVDALIGTVLAPASALLAPAGIEIPAASSLRAPESGPAGPWIHLWATTAILFVAVPRWLLAVSAGAKILSLRRRLAVEVPETHRQRLLASASTEEHTVDVLAYSYRPLEKALQTLREQLLDLVGARARVRVAPTIDYGADTDAVIESIDSRAGFRVLLFGLAQTPELEVHGELIAKLSDAAADGQRLLVVVDESSFRRKLDADVDDRVDSRRRAWRRVVEDAGLDPLFVDLTSGDTDGILVALDRVAKSEAVP